MIRPKFDLLLAVCATALAVIGLSACGSSKSKSQSAGAAGQSSSASAASQTVAAALKAGSSAKSVRIQGVLADGTKSAQVNVQVENGVGVTGTITVKGMQMRVIVLQNHIFVKLAAADLQRLADKAGLGSVVTMLGNDWLESPVSGKLSLVAKLVDLQSFFGQWFKSSSELSPLASTSVGGQAVSLIKDASDNRLLAIYKAAPQYPARVQAVSGQSPNISFSQYNAAVTVTAPSPVFQIPAALVQSEL